MSAELSVEKNKDVVRSLIENNDARNFDAIDDIVAPNFVGHHPMMPGSTINGREALKVFFAATEGESFPNGYHHIDHLFGEGDLVALHFTFQGTFKKALPDGTQPTGKEVVFRYLCICRLSAGKIVEIWWHEFDSYNLMRELGMIK